MLKIYSWDRCPDCTRLKFILYLKGIEFQEIIAHSDQDLAEMEQILGHLCAPTAKLPDGSLIDDSIHALQVVDDFYEPIVLKSQRYDDMEQWLDDFNPIYRQVIAPFWINLPIREFVNPAVKQRYTDNVMAEYQCSVDELWDKQPQFIEQMTPKFEQLATMIGDNSNRNYLYSIDEVNVITRLYWLSHIENVYKAMPERVQKYIDFALLHSKMPLLLEHDHQENS